MRKLIAVLITTWACLAPGFANAQTPGAKISGQVLDAAKKPVDAATVILQTANDSATVKTELSNPDGSFAFANLKDGDYRLVVTSVGYRNYKGVAFAYKGQSIKLPAITLPGTTKALKEVDIAAPKNVIEQKIDRTVVNVGSLISSTGSNALEVLERTPGVVVDDDGNITFKGKSGVMVMIDDKPTYLSGENLANYLKAMPASLLDQIELMDNPPAKYDAAGNAGVINIKTKKSKTKGFNGTFAASVGDAHYWRTQESLSLNYHVDKINLFANLGYGINKGYRRLDLGRNFIDAIGNPTSSYTEAAFFNPVSYNPNLKVGMDYYVTPKTTLGVVLTGLFNTGNNFNPVYSVLKDNIGAVDSNVISTNHTGSKFYNTGINLNYDHQFNKKGQDISINLDYLHYNSSRDQSFLSNVYNSAAAFGSTQDISDNLPAFVNIYSAKADFAQPLKGKGKIEAGIKTSYVNTDNAANYFNIINNISTVDNNNTNRFVYQENINAAYVSYDQEFKRFAVKAGLRVENTNVHGHQLGNAQSPDSSFTQHYTDLFPTTYLLYKLDTAGSHTLKVSYGRRIDRPNYQDLNPFITIIDKYSAFEGNPFLRPQFASEYELTYSYKSIFSMQLTYHHITDYMVENDFEKNGVFYATTTNLGSRPQFGLNASLNLSPLKWWSFNFYTEVVNNTYRGQLVSSSVNANTTYFYFNDNNQFTFPNGWSAEMSTFYLSPSQDSQFSHRYREQTNIGIQKKILKNKGAIKLTARDIFRANFSAGMITGVPNAIISYHNDNANRSATLAFTYNFGSNKDNPKRRDTGGAASEAGRVGN